MQILPETPYPEYIVESETAESRLKKLCVVHFKAGAT